MKPFKVVYMVAGAALVLGSGEVWAGDAKFSFSGGVSRRRIEASFDIQAPSWSGVAESFVRRENRGQIGLADDDRVNATDPGNGKTVIEYADGKIMRGDDFWRYWGGLRAAIDDPSQIGLNPDSHSAFGPVRTLNFHSYEYAYGTEITAGDGHGDDEQTVAAPYGALEYGGWALAGGKAAVRLQYTYLKSELSSGVHRLSTRTTHEIETTHTFTYDVGEAPLAEFQRVLGYTPDDWIVINDGKLFNRFPAAVRTGEHLNDPTASSASVDRVVLSQAFDGSQALRVHLHEIALTAHWTKTVASRVRLGIEAGPTLNLFRPRLEERISLLTNDQVASTDTRTSTEGQTKIGGLVNATVGLVLDKKGHLFLEGSAGGHWVDPFDVATPLSKARVKTDDFVVQAGLGITL
jgi:hypothetical protein